MSSNDRKLPYICPKLILKSSLLKVALFYLKKLSTILNKHLTPTDNRGIIYLEVKETAIQQQKERYK